MIERKDLSPPVPNAYERFTMFLVRLIDEPITWFREKIVEPNHKHYSYYHQQYRRVPTIDECYNDDVVCQFEANEQYNRDKKVEFRIADILRRRYQDCFIKEGPDAFTKCKYLWDAWEEAKVNLFIKYGDLRAESHARDAYMKQKHRMVWERRYGKVGTGKNPLVETEEPSC